jgi:hypothetical protein
MAEIEMLLALLWHLVKWLAETEHACVLGLTSSIPPSPFHYCCAKKWVAVCWILCSLSVCRLLNFVSLFAYASTLKNDALPSSETSVDIYHITRPYVLEDISSDSSLFCVLQIITIMNNRRQTASNEKSFNIFVSSLQDTFNPCEYITVDEGLAAVHGSCHFGSYI